ncbi:hypothetical protein Lal_00018661 [Lupinus albus]|nr:hypothetical protein Lal_00018661 [Lupinus albus]
MVPRRCGKFFSNGAVIEVGIPSRLDKYAKRFGFVHFHGVSNSKLMVEKLDIIWIDSYKIWVNIPKYGRKSTLSHPRNDSTFKPSTNLHVSSNNNESSSGIVGSPSTGLRDSRNFADVVKFGHPLSLSPQPPLPLPLGPSVDLEFQSTEQFPLWLRNSYFGIVHDNIDPEGLKDKLFLDGFYSINCTILGGRQVLLRSGEEGDLEAFIHGEPEWFDSRFWVLRKWELADVSSERFAWIRCYGIPLHAWENMLFHNLASIFGTYLGQDNCTISKHTLDEHSSSKISSDSCSSDLVCFWIDYALNDQNSAWEVDDEVDDAVGGFESGLGGFFRVVATNVIPDLEVSVVSNGDVAPPNGSTASNLAYGSVLEINGPLVSGNLIHCMGDSIKGGTMPGLANCGEDFNVPLFSHDDSNILDPTTFKVDNLKEVAGSTIFKSPVTVTDFSGRNNYSVMNFEPIHDGAIITPILNLDSGLLHDCSQVGPTASIDCSQSPISVDHSPSFVDPSPPPLHLNSQSLSHQKLSSPTPSMLGPILPTPYPLNTLHKPLHPPPKYKHSFPKSPNPNTQPHTLSKSNPSNMQPLPPHGGKFDIWIDLTNVPPLVISSKLSNRKSQSPSSCSKFTILTRSKSRSLDGLNDRERRLLEAKDVWDFGKTLGVTSSSSHPNDILHLAHLDSSVDNTRNSKGSASVPQHGKVVQMVS